MADVASAFIRGHQAGQAASAHEQATAENKIRTMILKHEMDRMKVDDAVREYSLKHAAQEAGFSALQGQPEAAIPGVQVGQRLPDTAAGGASTGLRDIVSSLVQGPQPGDAGPANPEPPTGGLADLVKAMQPGQATPSAGRKVFTPVQFSGLPAAVGGGTAAYTRTPQSKEELDRAAIALRRAEQPSQIVGPEQSLVGTNPDTGAKEVQYTNTAARPVAGEYGQFQQAYAESLGAKSFKDLTPAQKLAAMPAYARSKLDPQVQASIQAGRDATQAHLRFLERDAGNREADRKDAATLTGQRRLYDDYQHTYAQQHADAMKAWSEKNKTAMPGEEPAQPEYAPDDFETWSAAHPPKGKGAASGDAMLGERRLINGQLAEWDGKGWKKVGQ